MANPKVPKPKEYTPDYRRMRVAMPDLIKYAPRCMGSVNRLCRAAGINVRTYEAWNEEAERLIDTVLRYEDEHNGRFEFNPHEKLLAQFFEKVVIEVARCEIIQLQKVVDDEDWRSGAWLLERTNPSEFGRRRDIANLEDLLKFVRKYFGAESEEALNYVWDAIRSAREEKMSYDEQEAELTNTRYEETRAISDKSSSD